MEKLWENLNIVHKITERYQCVNLCGSFGRLGNYLSRKTSVKISRKFARSLKKMKKILNKKFYGEISE